MTLHIDSPRRERILLYGQEGSGKSHAWVSVAEWIKKTGSKAKVHVVDTDAAWDALRPEDGRLDDVVVAYPVTEWDDYDVVRKIRESSTPDDWYVLDVVTSLWVDAQEGYFYKVFGEELDSFFIEAKQSGESPGGEWGTNWVQIRRMYQRVMGSLQRYPGHVIACAYAGEVKVPDKGKARTPFHDSTDVEEKYGRYGWKPLGGSSKENIGHNFHTVVFMAETAKGWKMSVVKDRGDRDKKKKELQGVEVTPDFVVGYMMRNGWRP